MEAIITNPGNLPFFDTTGRDRDSQVGHVAKFYKLMDAVAKNQKNLADLIKTRERKLKEYSDCREHETAKAREKEKAAEKGESACRIVADVTVAAGLIYLGGPAPLIVRGSLLFGAGAAAASR